jgi:hypothetical protein
MELVSAAFPYLIAGAILATVAVLALGVVSMLRGGAFNARYSNKLMRARVALQATAIALFLVFLLILKGVG